jgi:hypothetical protein
MKVYQLDIPADADLQTRERLARLNNEFLKEHYWHVIDSWLLVLMIGLIVGSVAILAFTNSAPPKLIEWVEKYFYPLITLIFGYITGKTIKGKSSEK